MDQPPLTVSEPHERFHMAPMKRLAVAGGLAYATGFLLGSNRGGQTASLRFRAENAHRLPSTQRGWFLYHRAKGGYVGRASAREGNRLGLRLAPYVILFFGVEEAVDSARATGPWDDSRQDFLSTTVAGISVAGTFGLLNGLPLQTAARMTKLGLVAGFGFGLIQDFLHIFQGQQLAYVALISRITGFGRNQRDNDVS